LVSLEATQTGRESVTISWETATEKDIAGLDLERAEVVKTEAGEQVGGFSLVAERTPEGGPATGATYREIDNGVRVGHQYEYRLVSVEKDGSRRVVRSTQVEVVGTVSGTYSLEVTPNPAVDYSEIRWNAPRGEDVMVRIVDNTGRVIRSEEQVSTGSGTLRIDAREIASGQYIVELRSGTTVLTHPLQIQK